MLYFLEIYLFIILIYYIINYFNNFEIIFWNMWLIFFFVILNLVYIFI